MCTGIDQASLVESVYGVVDAGARHTIDLCDVLCGPGPEPQEIDERVRLVLGESKLLEEVGTLVC